MLELKVCEMLLIQVFQMAQIASVIAKLRK